MSELQTGQQDIFDYVKNNLGEGMIDVELDPKHYQTALDRAINRYRQRSSNAVEESYAFLTLKKDQNKYILPDEIINVRRLHRRTVALVQKVAKVVHFLNRSILHTLTLTC